MGNLIVTVSSIFIPLFNKLVTVPYILHPYRWGGVPWTEPSQLFVMFLNFVFNLMLLSAVSTLSGMMTTEEDCRKHDIWVSFKRSTWVMLGYVIGSIVIFLAPIAKAPILAVSTWIPYAGLLVHNALVSLFVMLFGAIGNSVTRADVCGS